MARKQIDHPSSFNESYTEKDQTNLIRIIDWMNESKNRSNRWLSKCIGASDGSISTLLSGKHPTEASEWIEKILPVMEDSKRDVLIGEFVETSTWMMVNHACRQAKAQGGFAIVAGSPGVGKSESLEEYKRRNPNTIYICGSEVTNSSTVMNTLITELGLKNSRRKVKSEKTEDIINALKDSGRLVILDETDKCQCDSADPLRTISDRTNCGVVLAGNINLRSMVIEGDNRYDLIADRVVLWPKVITQISAEDASMLIKPYIKSDMIVDYESFEEISAYAYEISKGSARRLIKTLMHNVILLDKTSRNNSKYQGINRNMMRQIAITFMGIDHPPVIPRRAATV